MDLLIRPALPEDAPALAAIYDAEVVGSYATFETVPQGGERFLDLLAGPAELLVGEVDGAVIGYASAGTFRPRPAYAATRETSVYVESAHRGRGYSRRLYAALFDRLRERGDTHTVVGVIALPNPASVALHESVGFRHVGTLADAGRKFDRFIDVGFYQLVLSAADAPSP